jgi:hypothetical protein
VAVTAFRDLPLADRSRQWDGAAAEKRVRAWAGAEESHLAEYYEKMGDEAPWERSP